MVFNDDGWATGGFNRKYLWVIGPMEDEHVFWRTQRLLEDAYVGQVVIPQQLMAPTGAAHQDLRLRLHHITHFPLFDGVALLDGWQTEPDCCLEVAVALALEIPCLPWQEWMENTEVKHAK